MKVTARYRTCFEVGPNDLGDRPPVMDDLSQLSTHCTWERKGHRLDYQGKLQIDSELIRTAASNIQKYRVWSVLQQFKDVWVCGDLCDLELGESESADARVWENLSVTPNVTPTWGGPQSAQGL